MTRVVRMNKMNFRFSTQYLVWSKIVKALSPNHNDDDAGDFLLLCHHYDYDHHYDQIQVQQSVDLHRSFTTTYAGLQYVTNFFLNIIKNESLHCCSTF